MGGVLRPLSPREELISELEGLGYDAVQHAHADWRVVMTDVELRTSIDNINAGFADSAAETVHVDHRLTTEPGSGATETEEPAGETAPEFPDIDEMVEAIEAIATALDALDAAGTWRAEVIAKSRLLTAAATCTTLRDRIDAARERAFEETRS